MKPQHESENFRSSDLGHSPREIENYEERKNYEDNILPITPNQLEQLDHLKLLEDRVLQMNQTREVVQTTVQHLVRQQQLLSEVQREKANLMEEKRGVLEDLRSIQDDLTTVEQLETNLVGNCRQFIQTMEELRTQGLEKLTTEVNDLRERLGLSKVDYHFEEDFDCLKDLNLPVQLGYVSGAKTEGADMDNTHHPCSSPGLH